MVNKASSQSKLALPITLSPKNLHPLPRSRAFKSLNFPVFSLHPDVQVPPISSPDPSRFPSTSQTLKFLIPKSHKEAKTLTQTTCINLKDNINPQVHQPQSFGPFLVAKGQPRLSAREKLLSFHISEEEMLCQRKVEVRLQRRTHKSGCRQQARDTQRQPPPHQYHPQHQMINRILLIVQKQLIPHLVHEMLYQRNVHHTFNLEGHILVLL